jgi:hypothetical protein
VQHGKPPANIPPLIALRNLPGYCCCYCCCSCSASLQLCIAALLLPAEQLGGMLVLFEVRTAYHMR